MEKEEKIRPAAKRKKIKKSKNRANKRAKKDSDGRVESEEEEEEEEQESLKDVIKREVNDWWEKRENNPSLIACTFF